MTKHKIHNTGPNPRSPAMRKTARKTQTPKPVMTRLGPEAVAAANAGAPLYVLNPQVGWVLGDESTLARANRQSLHGQWCYGSPGDPPAPDDPAPVEDAAPVAQ